MTTKLYDPQTAFGNPILIQLNHRAAEEAEAKEHTAPAKDIEEYVKYCGDSKCPFCGLENDFEIDDYKQDFTERCLYCDKRYTVTF